jgi:hypothetical protein
MQFSLSLLAQTNPDIPLNIVSRALESNGFAYLAGVLSGIFIITKWLDLPDKLLLLDNKLEKISQRQRRIFDYFYMSKNKGNVPDDDSEVDTYS